MSNRIEKLNELIKRELGFIILRELDLPRGVLTTITDVQTANDLTQSKVFVSVFPEEQTEKVLRILGKQVYILRQFLNERLKTRRVPKLLFLPDKDLAATQRIERLLDSL